MGIGPVCNSLFFPNQKLSKSTLSSAVSEPGFAEFYKKTDALNCPTITGKLLLVVENSNFDHLYFQIKSDFILAI